MGRLVILGTVATAVVLSAGCATSTDPSKGGFISGVSAISSGAYENRVQEREAALGRAQSENTALSADAARLEQQRAALNAELNRLVDSIKEMEASIQASEQRLAETAAGNAADNEQYRRLKSQVSSLRQEASLVASHPTLSQAEKEARIRELSERKAELTEGLDQVLSFGH